MPDMPESVTYCFDDFADMFVELRAFGTPAELHGLMCGQLAAGVRFDADAWLAMVVAHLDVQEIEDDDDKAELVGLYELALSQLSDGGFTFALLLPEDDTELAARAESLGSWCSGFLGGFGLAFDRKTQKLTADITETMDDLSQIALISLEDEDDAEAEQGLMELVEYVRMAALMVFSEFNQAAVDQTPPAVH
ncbi:MAG: UPF0149 family protein [Gammaproteobacteria bacterium]|jgi:hypothetical protein|nr:UPF0149 family protein [Gammaproteobacteria bacterium]